jgi:hypothetical protein
VRPGATCCSAPSVVASRSAVPPDGRCTMKAKGSSTRSARIVRSSRSAVPPSGGLIGTELPREVTHCAGSSSSASSLATDTNARSGFECQKTSSERTSSRTMSSRR